MMVTISQPRYLPALNYLQRICFSDVFVIFDTVQRQGRAFENRNKLLLPEPRWLTIPIASSSRALIRDTEIDGKDWIQQHKGQIIAHYKDAPCFDADFLEQYYHVFTEESSFPIAATNGLKIILEAMELPHNFTMASGFGQDDIDAAQGPMKLRRICEHLDADTYVSGENGRSYGVSECFAVSRCTAQYHCNDNIEYAQKGNSGNFVPYMGFFDALFNTGRTWFRDALLAPPKLQF